MKDLSDNYFNRHFSHIYVEESVIGHVRTKRILEKYPDAQIIVIHHYKDVFCRKGQDYRVQNRSPKLILAAKQGDLIYQGAPVCQDFGNHYFYYTSCIMNCLYDCEYCYLKGMYPSGNMVIFVNIEDIFAKTEELLSQHPVYLCVSYDTDIMAAEYLTGYTAAWVDFARKHGNLAVEVRTKSANRAILEKLLPLDNVIYAFTLSPQQVIDAYEHKTPGLSARIACAEKAVSLGMKVRLCFDPMIYCNGWEEAYRTMLKEVFDSVSGEDIVDVSVGSFRVSQDYLKRMRKNSPNSSVVQFPYENDGGVYHYPSELMHKMEHLLEEELLHYVDKDRIFNWNNR